MAFKAKLKYEGSVYRHSDEVQGELIPVYLENISLVHPYFLDFEVKIVHMLLMSWEGEQARKDLMLAVGRDLAVETSVAVTKSGVRDVRPPNVLWNPESGNVVLVDFERLEILKQVQVLQYISPNPKRQKFHHNKGISYYAAPRRDFAAGNGKKSLGAGRDAQMIKG